MLRKLGTLAAGLLVAGAVWAGPQVELQTSEGRIVLELDDKRAPATVDNFVGYARSGFYDGTIFHRVIAGFMIQGGGFTPRMNEEDVRALMKNKAEVAKLMESLYNGTILRRIIAGDTIQGDGIFAMKEKETRAPIRNEADNGLKNEKYTIAMARTSDPHSASAQFFINVADNAFLNHRAPTSSGWGYAVFGKVVEGREVVDRIARVATGRSGSHQDVPKEDVVIRSAKILPEKK